MPGGRPRKPAHLKQERRKSSRGIAVGGVGDEGERIADAIGRRNSGQGRPLDTMLLSVLVSLLLTRKRLGQAMPSPHYLRKFVDDDIKQVFTAHTYRHECADGEDPEWQRAAKEMQSAGFLASEIQHVKDQWNVGEPKSGRAPSASTIARYLGAALDIAQEL